MRAASSEMYGPVESSVLWPSASATSSPPEPARSIDVANALRRAWKRVTPGPKVRSIASRQADLVS